MPSAILFMYVGPNMIKVDTLESTIDNVANVATSDRLRALKLRLCVSRYPTEYLRYLTVAQTLTTCAYRNIYQCTYQGIQQCIRHLKETQRIPRYPTKLPRYPTVSHHMPTISRCTPRYRIGFPWHATLCHRPTTKTNPIPTVCQ